MSNIQVRSFETERPALDQFLYVGMDIHKDSHTAVVTNCFGQKLLELQISNSTEDFESLVREVETLSNRENRPVIFGLEDSYGYGDRLAKYLHQNNLSVRMVSPVLVDRARKNETHPEKNDSLDAFGIAKVLIQRIDTLPKYSITEASQISKNIKELSLDRGFLIKEQTRIKNHLHRLLHDAYNAEYREKFNDPFSLKALRYWLKHPAPIKSQNILVLKNQIKRKARRLLDIVKEVKEIEGELAELIKQSGQKLKTMNGCGVALTAQVLAEVRDISRFKSPDALAKYAGLCPRERSSGKTFKHIKSKSGNRHLNMAIHRIALSQISRSGNELAKGYFQKKISEGKTKSQALCCLKRRLVNVIYMMLKYKQEYRYSTSIHLPYHRVTLTYPQKNLT